MDHLLKGKLDKRRELDQLRSLKVVDGLVDFSSNDYLGIASDDAIKASVSTQYNILSTSLGSGGSRLLAGNSKYFEELEEYLAHVHKGEASLLMNSGYVANLAVFSSLPQKGDTVIYDELIHACIKDGVRLSAANYFSFKHNDLESLEKKIAKASGNIYVAVEAVYSMDGDQAPLKELTSFCKEKGAYLIVDEAHSTGVYGTQGAGLCCELGLEKDVAIRIHTFGKGMGCHGACVVGSDVLRQYLINFARPFIYTTAMPLHGLVTIKKAYEALEDGRRQAILKDKIALFKSLVKTTIESDSGIQVVVIPGNAEVKAKAQLLQEKGYDVRPVMSPTVREGSERLRICLHTHNSDESIKELAKLLS